MGDDVGMTVVRGLEGEPVGCAEIAGLPMFAGIDGLAELLSERFEPEGYGAIQAAVRRRYGVGDVICEAGHYGSTAFLLLEGEAVARVPGASPTVASIPGRAPRATEWLKDVFLRRRYGVGAAPSDAAVGEVTASAIGSAQPPPEQELAPGALFGIDACINHYPREATVTATGDCVVVEMLRSVLEALLGLDGEGEVGRELRRAYAETASAAALGLAPFARGLGPDESRELLEQSVLLTSESAEIDDDRIYDEGRVADALYVVRAGTVSLSRQRSGGETVLAYVGRGAVFGCEAFSPMDVTRLRIRRVSEQDAAGAPLGDVTTVGRAEGCDVVVEADQRRVGREHCRIERRGDDLFLVDLGSANGTLLNGEPISDALVSAGDVVSVGDVHLELFEAPETEAEAGTRHRTSAARALDRFEVLRIPVAALGRIAESNPALLDVLRRTAQAHEAVVRAFVAQGGLVPGLVEESLQNSQNALLIDLDRCTRCDECVRACADAHDGLSRFTRDGTRFGRYLVTMACRSCTDPKCMTQCPVGSIRRNDSLEIVIEDWCVGCQSCAQQCPFGNINMIPREGTIEEVSPFTAPAASAEDEKPKKADQIATVCDLCRGWDTPNCVYACPHDAAIRVNPSVFFSSGGS